MPDRTPHLHLVADESPAVREFRRHFGSTRTPFALCDGAGIVASNVTAQAMGFQLRALDTQALAGSPGVVAYDAFDVIVAPWDDELNLWLLQFLPTEPAAAPAPAMALDPMSGLPERAGFETELETRVAESVPEDGSLALFQLDFAQFDDIGRGHDRDGRTTFLREVATRLQACAGRAGIAARYDGAHFALLLPAPRGADGARIEAERLNEALSITCTLADGTEGVLRPRIGYALMPDDTREALDVFGGTQTGRTIERFAETAASLNSCAELALAHAHSTDAAPAIRFVPALIIAKRRREELARGVADAVTNGQMKVAFQPVINIATMKLAGFEALLRWRHPEYGPVPPPEAVAIAEANGALCALTRHVMREAIARCREWPDHVSFAVNVTPSQLNVHLVELIEAVLAEGDMPACSLEIEVTEDALIKDVGSSARVIDAIRALGVRVAMDDFGAGFTSLSNLKRLSFDKIKIDRSLCEGLGENARTDVIVGGLVRLADSLGIHATVEGVETEDQLAALEGLPCLVQGYVFSAPVPAQGMDAFRPMLDVPEPVAAKRQRSRPAARKAAS